MGPNGKVLAILCVRTSSDRLPHKVLAKTTDKWSLLKQTIWRLKMAQSVKTIVIATSTERSDDPIEAAGVAEGIPVYRGSLDNVVQRMWKAMETYGRGEPYIYRAMGDQPFMDWEALDRSTALMMENNWDNLLALAFKEDPVYGAGVAPWSYDAFAAINAHSTGEELEHPGMWLRRNLAKLSYGLIDLPHWCYRPYRLELDTAEDLSFVRALHDQMQAGHKPLKTIVRYLDKNSRLSEINNHIEEKTGTYTTYTEQEIKNWQKDYAGRPVVWSDVAGLIGKIDTAKQLTYRCPKCGGALIALHIVRGDLELECVQCSHKKKYYSAKPKRK
jgi:spore coat polysaccharide biosynthesis protein SpsF